LQLARRVQSRQVGHGTRGAPAAWRDNTSENALKEYQCRAGEGSTNKKTDPGKVGFLETHDSGLACQFDGHRTDSRHGRNRKLD